MPRQIAPRLRCPRLRTTIEDVERVYRAVMKLISAQSKMARAALGLGVRDLASLAGVSPDTIARLEGARN